MKKITAIIAALALAAAFTACGSVDESSVTEKKSPTAAQSPQEDIVQEDSSEPDDTADVSESVSEEFSESTSDDESSSLPEEEPSAPEPTDRPDLSAANDAEFPAPDGTVYTYGELRNLGTANYTDGYYYCLVPDGGGAGSAYYSLHYSADGVSWDTAPDFVQTLNGENHFFGMDNGTLVRFEYRTAEASVLPKVINYTFDAATHTLSSTVYDDLFDGLFTMADGSPVDESSILSFTVGYGGGRTFGCTFTDTLTGDTLFDEQITLPEE